ncbi:hypothetical protein [Candidatus Clostridium radicumherbarum]|uniref:Uncharacterized protein n=1 Tax=Candidatus Clostridium radicumherbarum TaxID=3381662 RepID=A0ABW8TR06_9CLOT
MSNTMGIFGAISSFAIIESMLRMLTYIAVISVSLKAIQALNTYINKNSR